MDDKPVMKTMRRLEPSRQSGAATCLDTNFKRITNVVLDTCHCSTWESESMHVHSSARLMWTVCRPSRLVHLICESRLVLLPCCMFHCVCKTLKICASLKPINKSCIACDAMPMAIAQDCICRSAWTVFTSLLPWAARCAQSFVSVSKAGITTSLLSAASSTTSAYLRGARTQHARVVCALTRCHGDDISPHKTMHL